MASDARFYCPDLTGPVVALPPEEAHHACAVLRLRPGDEIMLFDGAGTEGRGRLAAVARGETTVEVRQTVRVPFEPRIRLTLAVAMPRTHRQRVLFEKCTELGVFAIQPLICERSVAKPGPDSVAKWLRTAIEAAKQSRRAWIPRIESPRVFTDAVGAAGAYELAVLLTPFPDVVPLGRLLCDRPACGTMMAWIGPEGGFTDAEADRVVRAGALPARVGPGILRVETAAVVTAGLVAALADVR
ncbi:MAG: 16S rRNA (uracil(1498)-N(3))-methyltransferase [Phycisphaerales bacterium]|nr:MAG: 16S rRNA (uracil(1498)-N(3))-methyltransferase [Phycisphaerales bacterium]